MCIRDRRSTVQHSRSALSDCEHKLQRLRPLLGSVRRCGSVDLRDQNLSFQAGLRQLPHPAYQLFSVEIRAQRLRRLCALLEHVRRCGSVDLSGHNLSTVSDVCVPFREPSDGVVQSICVIRISASKRAFANFRIRLTSCSASRSVLYACVVCVPFWDAFDGVAQSIYVLRL